MAQKIILQDKVSDTVNKIGTAGQVVSAITRTTVKGKSTVTLTVPTGTIVVDEDILTISHTNNPNGSTPGQTAWVIGQ